jgi:small subunit ribosomal protein S1
MSRARVDILGPDDAIVVSDPDEDEVTEESIPNEAAVDVAQPPPEAVAQADGEPPAAPENSAPESAAPASTTAAAAPAAKPPRKPRDPAVIRAFRAGHPMDGLVEKVIKGGYEVRVGRCRGFCPHSQMDVHRVENAEEHVGKTYAFKILQLRRGGEDVVLSRREILQAEHSDEMKAVRATLIEGAVMTGRVARLTDFGAFVDLGAGVTGLVHLTELAHGRVVRPSDIVSVGDRVPVKITKLDDATGKISLSVKQAVTDPWESVPASFIVGKAYPGKLKRFADFGAFVELRREVEALAPAREFPPHPGGWREGLEADATREWVVIAVDAARRRITVVPAFDGWSELLNAPLTPGSTVTGKIVKAEVFGVFVWLGPGRVGMVPRVWSGSGDGPGFEQRFLPGTDIPVEVVDVSEGGKRIRLSVVGVDREAAEAARAAALRPRPAPVTERRPSPERKPRREAPPPAPAADPGTGFGSHLGEALRAALKRDE